MSDPDGPRRKVGHSRKRSAESQLSRSCGDKSCKMIKTLPQNMTTISGIQETLQTTYSNRIDPQCNMISGSVSSHSSNTKGEAWFSSSFSKAPSVSHSGTCVSKAQTGEELRNMDSKAQTLKYDNRNKRKTEIVTQNAIFDRRLEKNKTCTASFQVSHFLKEIWKTLFLTKVTYG